MQEVALPGTGGDAGRFLPAAVAFANEQCWGTLACAMFIHPATQRQHAAAFDSALAALRYGSISVNCATTVGFAVTALSWGGFPGHTPRDIKSGMGFVHNTFLFDHPQKSVLLGPWRYVPKPFWFVSHTNLESVTPAAFNFIAAGDTPKGFFHVLRAALHDLFG